MPPSLPSVPSFTPVAGSVVTPDVLQLSLLGPVFDGNTSLLGHRDRLTDAELDDSATGIKARVADIQQNMEISAGAGLTVTWPTSDIIDSFGLLATIPGSTLALPDNATVFVYVSESLVVTQSVVAPITGLLLARVTTVSGSISVIEDLRNIAHRRMTPAPFAVRTFGARGTTDYVASAGETLSDGIYYYRNFTVPSGVTLTIKGYTEIYCSGTFTVAGTIVCKGEGIDNEDIYYSAGQLRPYFNSDLSNIDPYSWINRPLGTKGTYGNVVRLSDDAARFGWGFVSRPGLAGGTLRVEAAGPVLVTGNILAVGENAVVGSVGDPTRGSTAGIYSMMALGSGGGSGGLIDLGSATSIDIEGTALLDVSGGDATDHVFHNPEGITYGAGFAAALGAGGGGGGYIVLSAPAVDTTGATLTLDGGDRGESHIDPTGGGTLSNGNNTLTLDDIGRFFFAGNGGAFGGAAGRWILQGSGLALDYVAATAGQTIIRFFTAA